VTAPDQKQYSNRYAVALLALSLVVTLAGVTYIVAIWAITPRGLDVIATNATLPSLYFGNALGWNALGLGTLLFGIWLGVQALRRR